MNENRKSIAFTAVGVTACVAYCAAPIAGFVTALSVGTVAAGAIFGIVGFVVAAAVAALLIKRRRSQA